MKRLLVLASVLAVAAPLAAASVGGKVNFIMKRGQTPIINETLVWLEPASGKAAPRPPAKFQITTRGKTLLPHVLAVPIGSTVEFPNDDPISHNLFSLSSASTFDLGLYRKGAGKSQKFATPGGITPSPTPAATMPSLTSRRGSTGSSLGTSRGGRHRRWSMSARPARRTSP